MVAIATIFYIKLFIQSLFPLFEQKQNSIITIIITINMQPQFPLSVLEQQLEGPIQQLFEFIKSPHITLN